MRRSSSLLALLSIAALLACDRKNESDREKAQPSGSSERQAAPTPSAEVSCPEQPPEPWHRRYVVGSSPVASVPGLGSAPACNVRFFASEVVELHRGSEDVDRPVLVKEGTFGGQCGDEKLDDEFESVALASVAIAPSAGVSAEQLEAGATKRLEVQVSPDSKFTLQASPRDRCGFPLNPGMINAGRNAKWSMGEGCDKVIESVPALESEAPGEGFDRPSDAVYLHAIAPGSCKLNVDYFGVPGSIEIIATNS